MNTTHLLAAFPSLSGPNHSLKCFACYIICSLLFQFCKEIHMLAQFMLFCKINLAKDYIMNIN